MDHRNGSRNSARLNVSIWQGDTHLGWYRSANLSTGGLAIRGRAPGLATNSLVRAQIEILDDGEPRYVDLQALVVHQDDAMIGLMWATDTAELAKLTPQRERRAA